MNALGIVNHGTIDANHASTNRLTIGGESAGANLAAVTLVRMRDRHGFTGFSGANMVSHLCSLAPDEKSPTPAEDECPSRCPWCFERRRTGA